MNKEAINVASILKGLAYAGGAAAGGGVAYGLGKGLDYNPFEKILSLGSGAIGGMALPAMAYAEHLPIPKALAMKAGIAAMILGEAAPATIRSIRSGIEAQNANKGLSDTINKWTVPALVGGGVGLGALGMVAAPALANISRAAGRIGDGRALRMSTSIRKRPNDPNDLKIEIMDPREAHQEAAEYIAKRKAQQAAAQQQPQSQGVLGKIFG